MSDLYSYRFGVNYTPTRNWYYFWNDFNADFVARDLDVIAQLECDHIRLMLVWPWFQPNPAMVSQAHLDRLATVMSLAADRNLDVCVSLFVGWLSGYNFHPPYQDPGLFYSVSSSGKHQELYVNRVAKTVQDHDNFLGFDLGNELNLGWPWNNLAEADSWQKHMFDLCSHRIPDAVHVNGVDHNSWFRPATFSPAALAQSQEIIPLHCWTYFSEAIQKSGGDPFGDPSIKLVATMAALARAWAGDPAKPIWCQEYGMSECWMDADEIPRFLEEATLSGIRGGVSWFTWWSSHDLDRALHFEPLEYSLGLLTTRNTIKPQGEIFREIAREYRGTSVHPGSLPALPPHPSEHTYEKTWKWLLDLP